MRQPKRHTLQVSPRIAHERAQLRRAATRFLRRVDHRPRRKQPAKARAMTAMTAAFIAAARTWLARHDIQTDISDEPRALARRIIDVIRIGCSEAP
jgi:hypothetical protein